MKISKINYFDSREHNLKPCTGMECSAHQPTKRAACRMRTADDELSTLAVFSTQHNTDDTVHRPPVTTGNPQEQEKQHTYNNSTGL